VDYAWEGDRLVGVATAAFTAGYTYGAAGAAPEGLQRTVFGLQPAAVADVLAEDLLGRRTSGTSTTRQGQGYGYGYTFDTEGRRAGMTRTDGSSWAFGYDGLDQLASAVKTAGAQSGPARTSTYTHDTIGNRTSANINGVAWSYTPDALNRYTSWVQGGAFASSYYDADGNVTWDGSQVYTWDAENRLVRVERPYPDPARWTYTYDAAWRRVRAVREASAPGSGIWTRTEERRWAYAGWMPLAEWRDTGAGLALWRTYVWGLDVDGRLQGAGGVGGLLAIHEHAGAAAPTASWLPGWDGNGNAIAWTNGQSGALAATVTTGAFGEPAHVSNTGGVPADVLGWAFSTKPTDPDTGHAYYGYRWYNRTTGRWLSRDPIEERGGLNLYGMVGNDPVGRWDLWGLAWEPTESQGLHYNDRRSTFGFGLDVDGQGRLVPVPLGGDHVFDETRARQILNADIADRERWQRLRRLNHELHERPGAHDKLRIRRVGKALRAARVVGLLGCAAATVTSNLPDAVRDYVNATSYEAEALAATMVAEEAARLGLREIGGVALYYMLMD
jgi:RHS repeat-associated protein